jgi:hypothetical protein
MSSHTPGHWTVERSHAETNELLIISGPQNVAKALFVDDAYLIAAAPELLAVAKLILKEWEAPTDGVRRGELIARLSQYAAEARAAIERTEGRK